MHSELCQAQLCLYEGPKMDWAVNDGLHHRFLKWRLKCENILKCELAMVVERKKCKRVIAWSMDFGIDQDVSWNHTNEELTLDVTWENFEEFCKPQSNEVRPDLTCSQALDKVRDQLINGTMLYKHMLH